MQRMTCEVIDIGSKFVFVKFPHYGPEVFAISYQNNMEMNLGFALLTMVGDILSVTCSVNPDTYSDMTWLDDFELEESVYGRV